MNTADKLLLPSMMCADFGRLADDVAALEEAGADGFHLDLMDGTFVPNYGMGLQDIEWISKNAHVPCDVHMMVEQPGRYIQKFADLGVRVIYVHPEADQHIARTLAMISALGVKAGIAINPGTSFAAVETILPLCDDVLVMTVNPGFAGQSWLDFVNPKIEQLVEASNVGGNHYKVLVDGNCSPERIAQASKMGVQGFVLGTAGLFGHGPYAQSMAELRAL
ncbi:MAG: ribulose-phosphate 3-epimerase [Atopobiaceae bacterium]|nr:ribulose-phosphate 3-epimerase [Atopobiaceae bacterium]MDO4404562.1 ribulose-phosphate 3-epimerase [Atopobiaceae bacterium]